MAIQMTRYRNRYHERTAQKAEREDVLGRDWMRLSEEKQEAILGLFLREAPAAGNQRTPRERYHCLRRTALRHCLSWRHFYSTEQLVFFRTMLRERQLWMLELRTFYKTGRIPDHPK